MRKRVLKPLVYVLVAAQLLLAVPAVAFAQGASSTSASAPCDEMQSMASNDHCPCCPDGGMSMSGCLASCAIASLVHSREFSFRVSAPASRMEPMASIRFASLSSPPLKPPPIV